MQSFQWRYNIITGSYRFVRKEARSVTISANLLRYRARTSVTLQLELNPKRLLESDNQSEVLCIFFNGKSQGDHDDKLPYMACILHNEIVFWSIVKLKITTLFLFLLGVGGGGAVNTCYSHLSLENHGLTHGENQAHSTQLTRGPPELVQHFRL